MPRQQVQDLDLPGRIAPVASPTSGFTGQFGRAGAPVFDVRFIERLGDRGQRFFADLSKNRSRELLEKARVDIADGGELVDQLLDSVGDPEARREALRQAEEAGVISGLNNPYKRLALAEAEGRRAANRAADAVSAALTGGEHRPTEDENGARVDGTSIQEILDREFGRFESSPALQTEIGAAAFNAVAGQARPALQRLAEDDIAGLDQRRLVRQIQDEIAGEVRTMLDLDGDDLADALRVIEERATAIALTGTEKPVETAAEAVLRGIALLADSSVTDATELLNTVVGDVRVNGVALDENPRTAEMLAQARHRFRRQLDDEAGIAERQRVRTREEHLRSVTDLITENFRTLTEGGITLAQATRATTTVLENSLTRGSRSVEYARADNTEFLRTEGLRLIEAVSTETAASNRALAEELRSQYALSTTTGELDEVDALVRQHGAAGDVVGRQLVELLEYGTRRRQRFGLSGVENSATFGRAYGELNVAIPEGAPLDVRFELNEASRRIDADFLAAVEELAATGSPDPSEVARLGREGLAAKLELFEAHAARITQARGELFEAVRTGATPEQVRAGFGARLSQEEVQRGMDSAERRELFMQSLPFDPRISASIGAAQQVLLNDPGLQLDPQAAEQASLALQREIQEEIRQGLEGQPLDTKAMLDRAIAITQKAVDSRISALRQRSAERATEERGPYGASAPEEVARFTGSLEGVEAVDRPALVESAAASLQDRDLAAAVLHGAAPITFRNSPALTRLWPEPPHTGFQRWQRSPYRSGLFQLGALAPSAARRKLELEVAREERAGTRGIGRLYVAALSPVGIPIDQIISGEVTIQPGKANISGGGGNLGMVGARLKEPVTFRIRTGDVPPFSTPMFSSVAQLERFWASRRNELDPLLEAWGILEEEAQMEWVRVQRDLAERAEKAEFTGASDEAGGLLGLGIGPTTLGAIETF